MPLCKFYLFLNAWLDAFYMVDKKYHRLVTCMHSTAVAQNPMVNFNTSYTKNESTTCHVHFYTLTDRRTKSQIPNPKVLYIVGQLYYIFICIIYYSHHYSCSCIIIIDIPVHCVNTTYPLRFLRPVHIFGDLAAPT